MNEIEATADGHPGFAAAYAAHGAAVYNYVLRMVANEADAEDLTLAAFEKALRAWRRRPPDGQLRAWLLRIATNTCLDELRRRQRAQWRPWHVVAGLFHRHQVAPDNPEEEVLRRETAALVQRALAQLSPRDRAALLLRESHGLSVQEVGQVLGISTTAAKVALYRARERLRAAYLRVGGEFPGEERDAAEPDGNTLRPDEPPPTVAAGQGPSGEKPPE